MRNGEQAQKLQEKTDFCAYSLLTLINSSMCVCVCARARTHTHTHTHTHIYI